MRFDQDTTTTVSSTTKECAYSNRELLRALGTKTTDFSRPRRKGTYVSARVCKVGRECLVGYTVESMVENRLKENEQEKCQLQ